MAFKTLIKKFDFISKTRKLLVFSDITKIRLDDDNKKDLGFQGITLKPNAAGEYDIGLANTALIWTTTPKKLKKWLGFEALETLPANTSVGYRLVVNNGATEKYWNGTAWATATTSAHWNDFQTINANIQALVLIGFDLAVKVNLRSSDGVSTPRVRWIKLLVQVFFDPWDDLIYDTVIGSMRQSLRAITATEFAIVTDTTSIDLQSSEYKLENKGYDFTNIIAAYNLTSDQNGFKNIASSYVPGSVNQDGTKQPGVITLTEEVGATEILRLEMEYVPVIAVFTNQEYVAPEKLPAIVFERIATIRLRDGTDQELNDTEGESVRNFDTYSAVVVPVPRQSTVRFEFALWASPLDLARLADAIDKWLGNNRLLKTWAFDDEINVDPVNEIETSSSTNLDDVVVANGIFQLRGVPFYIRPEKTVPLIKSINATFEST